jgi:hypothetical protein
MPGCHLIEVLTIDVRSGAGDEVLVVLCPAILAIVPVHMALLTAMFCPF